MLGYYPPNHKLMIGMDPLNLFEEFMELPGQAKLHMASKEEIDNSGLEVIHMSSLAKYEKYEKAGQVTPMCMDRVCLSVLSR